MKKLLEILKIRLAELESKSVKTRIDHGRIAELMVTITTVKDLIIKK